MSIVYIAHWFLVFSFMRVYAISDHSLLLAGPVGVLSIVPVVIDAVCLLREMAVLVIVDLSAASG